MKQCVFSAVLTAFLSLASLAEAETLMLEQPALSADHLAFVYAGDIWVAARNGASPRRLTSSRADERNPYFSPDGRWIAFEGKYDDNVDVYLVSVEGGQPRRLTWHPGDDVPLGWTADGASIALYSRREIDHGRAGQLYHVRMDGGYPVKQMEARVFRGSWHPDGERFAYIAHASGYNGLFGGSAGWKGYRGGTTPEIHIMNTQRETLTTIPGAGATNFNPMWVGETLYFISDRDPSGDDDKTFNIYRYDIEGGAVTQVTNNRDWDVRRASAHGGTIVYTAGGRLFALDIASGESTAIPISIQPDLPQLRTTWKDAAGTIQHIGISPTGKRAIITARGDVFTVPVDKGSTRNLTASDGERDYEGLWSPGGSDVAYIVDSLDGQRLLVEPQTGIGEHRSFDLGPHFYSLLAWSPNDETIVFEDNHLNLFAIDLGSGSITTIDRHVSRDDFNVAFSPDSRWLAYTRSGENFYSRLMVYDFDARQSQPVTGSRVDVAAPAFSRDGKYLFFAGSTNSGPLQIGLNMTSQERPYRAALYAAVLAADGQSPLLPESGDEGGDADEGEKTSPDDGDSGGGTESGDEEPPAETIIDFDGLAARIVALPVAEANYHNLAVGEDGNLYYLHRVQPGASTPPPGEPPAAGNELRRFSFEEREMQSLLTGVTSYVLSADGEQLLLRMSDESIATASIGDELEPEPLALDGLRMRVNPRREWTQIFNEAWRMEREYFYADNMHGVDWDAVYAKYRPLLDHVGRREDLNTLLVQMIAELRVGHNRVGRGDVYQGESANTGLLGANFEIDNGHYRLSRIYTGEAWNPFLKGPLSTPGNAAREGEYLLAVNGQALSADDNLFAMLQGTSGQQVTLLVGPSTRREEAREITVEPVDDERMLRLWHWVEANRRVVDEATDGRVGYIYLPNTAGAGYTFFNRMFHEQIDREALIVDERSNSGGQAANYITDVLSRKHLSGWKPRDGMVFNTPSGALHGPKLMLIDQDAGSGGDYLPYAFRQLGIGKLMGTRTWGGLIGISANPPLTDGGVLTVPFFRFFDPQGNWTIENEGVTPDIAVTLDPIAANRGRDSQLESAIAEILRQLEAYEDDIPRRAPDLPTEAGR